MCNPIAAILTQMRKALAGESNSFNRRRPSRSAAPCAC